VVWKYRYKKAKLWKNLEKKYGTPVLEEHEWADARELKDNPDNEEHEDLDHEDRESSTEGGEQDL
jgi:hypothetical protein